MLTFTLSHLPHVFSNEQAFPEKILIAHISTDSSSGFKRYVRIARWIVLASLLVVLGWMAAHAVFWSPRNAGYPTEKVLVIAHRGASEAAPENTLIALRRAIEFGADAIELDVGLSKDNEVVIMHDDTVDRTTNGSGKIREMSLSELKKLDAGSWFSPEFAGEPVPTLQEALDVAKGRAFLEIELKPQGLLPTGLESRVAELVVQNNMTASVVVTSFNPFQLLYLRQANSDIATGLLYSSDLPFILRDRWFSFVAHPDGLRPNIGMATAEQIRQLKTRGHQVIAWTINEPEEMRKLIGDGIDGIITDRPEVLRDIVDDMHQGG